MAHIVSSHLHPLVKVGGHDVHGDVNGGGLGYAEQLALLAGEVRGSRAVKRKICGV